MLDKGVATTPWDAGRPDQQQPVEGVTGGWLDAAPDAEINRILRETIRSAQNS
jgi:hypothetical protein